MGSVKGACAWVLGRERKGGEGYSGRVISIHMETGMK